ncbi:hypothetical protein [Chitinophaga solisilvae]|uniref:hypothetical protein n=1 Tax=Chitinophaga solisilvae TaxID=1233460 RepID=UPI00136BB4A8|nr:hypothetical protein [Chitinophaga solisilvae]
MAQDPLITAWNSGEAPQRSPEALQAIVDKGSYPVRRGIRNQLLLEAACYLALLLAYYDIFDGHTRPLTLNLILVAAIAFMLLHNILGYIHTAARISGREITRSLQQEISRLRQYAIISVLSRATGFAGLITFFAAGIRWTPFKYWILGAAVLILLVQLYILSGIWRNRISRLRNTLLQLTPQ